MLQIKKSAPQSQEGGKEGRKERWREGGKMGGSTGLETWAAKVGEAGYCSPCRLWPKWHRNRSPRKPRGLGEARESPVSPQYYPEPSQTPPDPCPPHRGSGQAAADFSVRKSRCSVLGTWGLRSLGSLSSSSTRASCAAPQIAKVWPQPLPAGAPGASLAGPTRRVAHLPRGPARRPRCSTARRPLRCRLRAAPPSFPDSAGEGPCSPPRAPCSPTRSSPK